MSFLSHTCRQFLNTQIPCCFPEGVLPEKLGGVCGPLPKTLTLFMTKICDIPYPIYVAVRPLRSWWNKGQSVTMLRQRTLFAAVLLAVVQVMLASLSSSSTDLIQVFTGLPTFLLPCGFHSRTCLVVSDVGFRNVWSIQFHLRLTISAGIHSCSVLAQSSLLLIFSGQYIFRIFLRHRLVKVYSL